MSKSKTPARCFNCDASENEVPLINLSYAGNSLKTCPQCMPKLIHQPEMVKGRLSQSGKQS